MQNRLQLSSIMVCLSISLLGSLSVTLVGQPVDSFEYNKVRALLAYLAIENESPHRREALACLLWPDQPQKAALDSLRNALSKLRQAIGDHHTDLPYLFITNDAIQFNHASDHKLDVNRFTNLLAASKSHHHRRLESCKSCSERLKQAFEFYQGEFLKGFYLADSDLFNDWVSLKREKYSRMALESLQQLASIYEWRGDYDQALAYAHRQLELDPCLEDAHTQAIRLLGILGKRSEACAQYEKCRQHLNDDLGVEPSDETTRLYEQIKYSLFQMSPDRQRTRINNLPPNLTSFVGRERELMEINNLLEDPSCRLLSLIGPGGVGKTRLAIAVAGQQMEAFLHGACFVPLAGTGSVEFIVPTILENLNITPVTQSDIKEQLIGYLRDKEMVLVLDNFEHLVEGAGLVAEILQQAPGVMLLVTSRQRLGLQAEWLFEVYGLSYPPGKAVQDLAAYDSVQLFTQRLHQLKTRVTLFQHDLPGVSRICQLVEGLPLGIELAASAVRLRSIEQVAQAIESGKEDLKVSYKDLPERHRSIRAVFEHSYLLLNQTERKAFCGLAVFRGLFTAEASLQVADASPQVLATLVEHSLVRYNPERERYDLHELVRQYALEKLIAQGMEPTLRQRHLRYYIDLAEQAETCFFETNKVEQFASLAPEVDNFQAALEECFYRAQMEETLQLAGALGHYWLIIGYLWEGDAWFGKILGSGYRFPRDRILARALVRAGFLAQINGDFASARALYEQSLSIWQELGDQSGIGWSLSRVAVMVGSRGDFGKAIELLEESLQIYHQLDDQAHIAYVLMLLGATYFSMDNLDEARTLFEESLKINRRLGLDGWAGDLLGALANLEMCQGNFNQARSLFEESLALFKDGNIADVSYALDGLGLASFYLEDYPAARAYMERSIEIARKTRPDILSCLCNLSFLICHQGEHEQALYYLREVFRQVDDADRQYSIILDGSLEQISGVLQACGEPERAARLAAFAEVRHEKLDVSLPRYIRPDYERSLAETRRQLGEAAFAEAWALGRSMTLEQAKKCAMEAKVRIIPETRVEMPI